MTQSPRRLRTLGLGLVIAAALQTAVLGWMIRSHWADLKRGTEVVLEATMVDPRDFFRGHYVTLQLNIQRVDRSKFVSRDQLETGKPIYVSLQKSAGPYWSVVSLTTNLPESGPFLKSESTFNTYMLSEGNKNKTVRIRLPFTRYYAPKKQARELEKLRNAGKMGIVVSVLPDGRGKIKGISMDGVVVYDESVF